MVLPAERTAGDEVQLLLQDPAAVIALARAVVRDGGWWLGIGLGRVELPLPDSTRAARGAAYLAAREAVDHAHASPVGICLAGQAGDLLLGSRKTVSGDAYGGDTLQAALAVSDAEAALWLQAELWQRRTTEGWQIVDLLDAGSTVGEAAAELGISASAASQRRRRAGHETELRGVQLCTRLLVHALDAVGRAA